MLVRALNIRRPSPLRDPSHLMRCWFSLVSPTSDGAGAAVLASEAFVRKHHLESQAVEIVAQEMTTDTSSTFEENSCMKMVSPFPTDGSDAEFRQTKGLERRSPLICPGGIRHDSAGGHKVLRSSRSESR